MGDSLWVLVDRYDQTLCLVRAEVARVAEELQRVGRASHGGEALWERWLRWSMVLTDLEVMRDRAAAGCEKLEGPRAA